MTLSQPIWLLTDGPDSDVVVSTRSRLARNLMGIPFPWKAAPLQSKIVAEAVLDSARRAGQPWRDAEILSAERLSQSDLERLIEYRYASAAWSNGGVHRWVLISVDGAVSLMINEEDHLRIQTILPGFQPQESYDRSFEAERKLAENLTFAAKDEVGFLTPALTNAGAGLRISIILHLPALHRTGDLTKQLGAASELAASIRGLYGEGTKSRGAFYQLSNRRSFGIRALNIVGEIAASAAMLVSAEREARSELYHSESGRRELAEEVYGEITEIIRSDPEPARLLEAISILRLGAAEKLLDVPMNATSEWMSLAGIRAAMGECTDPQDARFESVRRAAALRTRLRAFLQR